jgi:PhnB protein
MQVQPFLYFEGRCEEALEFYRKTLGAQVTSLARYGDAPPPKPGGAPTPGIEQKVMYASLRIGDSTVLASDGHCEGRADFKGFSLSLTVSDDAEAQRLFAALADGGTVKTPMAKTFFSSRFGMLTDRFGVAWMIYVEE